MVRKDGNIVEGEKLVHVIRQYLIRFNGQGDILFNRCPDLNQSKAEKNIQTKEDPIERERRIWREKLYTNSHGNVILPGHNLHQAMITACKYWGQKIQGEGNKTYSNVVSSAVIAENLEFGVSGEVKFTPIHKDDSRIVGFGCNCNGNPSKGGCSTVWKIRPCLTGWEAEGTIMVLDQRLTLDVLRTIFTTMGVFVGLGDWRPQHGRFALISIEEI